MILNPWKSISAETISQTGQEVPAGPRLNFWLTLLGVSIIVSVGSAYLYLIEMAPLPFAKMDFDDDGFVTFGELQYANSYATRDVVSDGKLCTEYYALKDKKRLKMDCE